MPVLRARWMEASSRRIVDIWKPDQVTCIPAPGMIRVPVGISPTMQQMYLLLPPSEGKAQGGSGSWDHHSGRFALAEQRSFVLDAVRTAPPRSSVPPTGGSLPAFERYTGVVWQHLEPATLSATASRRARTQVLVASGLGGLFCWDDPVPSYKLKMAASTPQTGRLSKFWSRHLPSLLSDKPVIDLLALEQSAALPVPGEHQGWWRVELVGPTGERSGHNGKAAKGRLARALLSTDDPIDLLGNYEDLEGWSLKVQIR